ncbi:MAG: type II toxin-antitoxin system RelE/ParE family toxin [Gammaproteobacteria bacterium]
MKLKWTRRALRQLVEAQDYIAQENPLAARQIAERIGRATRLLLLNPKLGRRGRVPKTREWVVSHTPYFLVYSVSGDVLQVLRVVHGKQHWPPI